MRQIALALAFGLVSVISAFGYFSLNPDAVNGKSMNDSSQIKWKPSISFCIITNGRKPEKLKQEIESIQALDISNYEIIISGRLPAEFRASEYPALKTISNFSAADNGQLGAMRNDCCRAATKEVLVVVDDDMVFMEDFYKGICQFGDDFDVLPCRLLNTDGTRFWDWAVFGGDEGQHLLDYGETSPDIYVTGGLCILKPAVFSKVQWNNELGFYQQEDVDFSRRLKAAGFRISFNSYSTVAHDDEKYSQVDNLVVQAVHPFSWVEITAGVIGRGIYSPDDDFRWIGPSAEFRFAKSTGIITISFALSPFPNLSAYENGKLEVLFVSQGVELGRCLIQDENDEIAVSLTLEPGVEDFQIQCLNTISPFTLGAHKDLRILGAMIKNLAFQGVDKALVPNRTGLPILDKPRTHILASAFDNSELSRAVRAQLFTPGVSDDFSLGLLRNDKVLSANFPVEKRSQMLSLAPKLESLLTEFTFHDATFVLGTNLFKSRADRWENPVFLGPASAVTEDILSEVFSGFMRLGVFSTEELNLLLSSEIPKESIQLIPLLPPVAHSTYIKKVRADKKRVFIPWLEFNGTNTDELLIECKKIIAVNSGIIFNFWTSKPEFESVITEKWLALNKSDVLNPISHLHFFNGTLPDQTLDKVYSHMTVALFPQHLDPYAYFVKECLVREIPVIGLNCGARKDIPKSSGFVGVSTSGEFAGSTLNVLSQLSYYENECISYRENLRQSQSTVEYLQKLSALIRQSSASV